MNKLKDLQKLGQDLKTEFESIFIPDDIELPSSFKDTVKELGGYKFDYKNYLVHIYSNDLNGYIPNQWFIIASFFVDYYLELQSYKNLLIDSLKSCGLTKADDRRNIMAMYSTELGNKPKDKPYDLHKTETITKVRSIISNILLQNQSLEEQDRDYLINFVSDYDWWYGGKTIDRGDFYVSPILSLAKVVNASHSYIAEICKAFAETKGISGILKDGYKSHLPNRNKLQIGSISFAASPYRPHISAIKTKPFLLLAGISGTGKSRIVRELARACWDKNDQEEKEEYEAHKPRNFEMVQVKPNWHDSSELIGYVSRVSGKAEYVAGNFLKFVARAWENLEKPYFLCLDEMNLAPVEQYFAEYLSVVESRKSHEDGTVTTDPILPKTEEEWYFNLTASLTTDEDIRKQFNDKGICLPQNLIVVGTVNMDETTFSFSRKVLDRAMTIEMNEVDLMGGLTERHETIGKLGCTELVGSAVEGVDVYKAHKEMCDKAIEYLTKINAVLEGTPFKVAYRTRNEFLLYVVNNLPYNKDDDGNELPEGYVVARALDEITSMKVLSRIEGDDTKVKDNLLKDLKNVIEEQLKAISDEEHPVKSVSIAKLTEMRRRLESGYTSFWS